MQSVFRILKRPFVIFLSLLAGTVLYSQSQIYPVSVTTQLTPPYSVNLADYAAPGCEQLKVIILQRDLTQAPYMLYLRMEIWLNGRLIIRTSPEYIPQPLTLEPGIPTIISGSDLYSFFDLRNMDFVGYSRDSYLRTKTLPEGSYIISFTSYDWTRKDVALSKGGAFYGYLAKVDPPLLNIPLNNTVIKSTIPQFISFQWLSRSTSSPNSSMSTSFRFELFEMRLPGSYPSEIVQISRPVFSVETDRMNLSYTIEDPPLVNGMRYAWRVQAFDNQGRDYISNNGYSEVYSFIYGESEQEGLTFNTVDNFVAVAINPRTARLSWDAKPLFDSYKAYYRVQGKNNKWYESETVRNSLEISGLTSGSIYECRVQGKKGSTWGEVSVTDTVLMPLPAVINCGSSFEQVVINNREPLTELMSMQEINAGGFTVTIIESIPNKIQPGRFSGKGFVQVPLMANKKIRCVFTNILLNTDYQMTDGAIFLVTDNNGVEDNAVWNIDDVFEGGSDNGKIETGTEGISEILPDVVIQSEASVILDTLHKLIIVVNDDNDTVLVDISDELAENQKVITIKDSEGSLYNVDTKTGETTLIGKPAVEGGQQAVTLTDVIDIKKGFVVFEPVPGKTKYAFDMRNALYAQSNIFSNEYQTLKLTDGTIYDVANKLIPVGESDVVLARVSLKEKTLNPDSVVFCSSAGTNYTASKTGKKGEYLLTLPSGKENDGVEVYAKYNEGYGKSLLLGKLLVFSYSVKKPRLVLVPVNDNTGDLNEDEVKRELDKVYLRVAVDWQISIDDSKFTASSDNLNISGSGLFSQYTDGMMALNNSFIAHKGSSFDASALYLFILQYSDQEGITGDMPRSKQFGYIFTATARPGGKEAIYRTIAHEISHGAFHLNHTFDSQYKIEKGTTQNLLDYTAGTDLVKHQWDAIHDPGLVIGILERDEEGEHVLPCLGIFDDCEDVLKKIEAIKKAYNDGKTISGKIPESIREKTLIGTHMKLGSGEFDIIKVCLYGESNKEYTINPNEYTKFWNAVTPYENDPEKRIMNAGFEFKFDGKNVLRVFAEANYLEISKKFEILKEYLFGSVKNEIMLNDVKWIHQEDRECIAACKSIVSSYSNSDRILMTNGALTREQIVIMKKSNDNCSLFMPTELFNDGIQKLDELLLKEKVPVTIGVYRPARKRNPSTNQFEILNKCETYNLPKDASTVHFVVINGIGYYGNRKYYHFLDVGASNEIDGDNIENKLFIDGQQIKGTSAYFDNDGRFYIVTEIRLSVITKK